MEDLLKGLYTATSAMITQQRRTEMLSNNIANANTSGYKEDQGSIRAFPEMLLSRIEGDKNENRFRQHRCIHAGAETVVYAGSLKTTDQPTDIALMENQVPKNAETNENAELFYPVQTAGGVRYSKAALSH